MRTALLALAMATAPLSFADGPANLGMTRGALTAGDRLLFVSDVPEDGPCKTDCSARPFLAETGAVPAGLWTLKPASGGMQWVYDGSPLFVWPEIGDNRGKWYFGYDYVADYYGLRAAPIKDPVAEGFAVLIDDPRVVSAPQIERKMFAKYNLRDYRQRTASAVVTLCVDAEAATGGRTLTTSSGSDELDELAMDFARVFPFIPAKLSGGAPTAVCGFDVTFDWPHGSVTPGT